MSEYQYYEFRKIDGSLSDVAMEEVSDLSSRAAVSRNSASFSYNYRDFPANPITSASTLFAEARRLRTDRERQASERQAALELRRLNAIERDEKALWLRVDELITSKSTKAYDEAITILKDLRALALHKEQRDEFVRRVEAIRQKYSRLSGLQWRIQDSKLLDGSESEDTP
jgi:hypothetical protein